MAKFAKLLETPHGQLLATLDYEDDEHRMVLRGESRNGIIPSYTFTFEDQTAQQAALEALDQASADNLARALNALLIEAI
jgi:hypothetical protein